MFIISDKGNMSKVVATVFIIVYILLLIPILYIGRYDYHCADDFGFSASSHVAWERTHSLISVFQASVATVVDRWHTWQGTFTTMFFMAIEPGIFGDTYYHFVPWMMVFFLIVPTMFMLYELLVKVMSCSKSMWIIISMLYLIYVTECIVDPLQGFFWYNGAAHYMIPHGLAMVLVGMLLKVLVSNKRVMICAISCVLSFLLGGSNYITALSTGVGLVFAIFACIFMKKKENMLMYAMPILSYIPAFLLNILAPGNSVRQMAFPNHPGPIKAIMLAFYYCVDKALSTWLNWGIIVVVLLFIPLALNIVKRIKSRYQFDFKYPLLVIIISFCFLSAMFAPTSYASGDAGGGRVENIIFLDYVLIIMINEVYFLGWMDNRLHIVNEVTLFHDNTKRYLLFYSLVIIGALFCAGLTVLRDANSFTTSSAIVSLANGEAKRYGVETSERTAKIMENDGKQLVLTRFVETPYLLYMDDIVPDSDDWRNNSMERYYEIEEIIAISQ